MTQTHNDGRILLDKLTLPVLELDRAARILYCNAATAAVTGVAHAALVGQGIGDVFPEWHGSPLATAMQALLEVLPVGTAFSNVELPGDVAGAGNDFDALEKLRRLALTDRVEEPKQLELWNQNL